MVDPICGMTVNEKSPFSLQGREEKLYFCSRHCLEKFAKENGIPLQEDADCCATATPWYKNKIFIAALSLAGICALSYVFPLLVPFRHSLFMYVQKIWWTVLLGLILGGVIDYYVPREYISHILAQSRKRTIFSPCPSSKRN